MSPPEHFEIRPGTDEYGPGYAGYVARVQAGDVVGRLESQLLELQRLFTEMPRERLDFRYAPAKWTPREILGHLCDTERVMQYRALCVARGDITPLPGFDENGYVAAAEFGAEELAALLEQLRSVRVSTLTLLRSLPAEALTRRGSANGAPVTARALAWIIVGHADHHVAILRQRYLEPGTI